MEEFLLVKRRLNAARLQLNSTDLTMWLNCFKHVKDDAGNLQIVSHFCVGV